MRKIDADALQKAMEFVTNDPTCPMHIAANIDQIIDCEPTVDDWIRCSEKMPEDSISVLLYGNRIGIVKGFFTSYKDYYIADSGNTAVRKNAVTHWMPLPELPKEE